MELEQARALAREIMDRHGLTGWGFRFNQRKRALGLCHHDLRLIELAAGYTRLNDEREVRHTILHEVAHALVGARHGHDGTWKAMALKLGVVPRSCAGPEVLLPPGRWTARCGGCSRVFGRERRPRQRAVYWCRACGPEAGRLTYQPTALFPGRG